MNFRLWTGDNTEDWVLGIGYWLLIILPSSSAPHSPMLHFLLQATLGFLNLGLQDRLLSIRLALDGF